VISEIYKKKQLLRTLHFPEFVEKFSAFKPRITTTLGIKGYAA
jgi:hypothetical protein